MTIIYTSVVSVQKLLFLYLQSKIFYFYSMEDNLSVLSDDLVAYILGRLPPKSLLTFKRTCKRWCSFISDPKFQRIYTFNLQSLSSCYPAGLFTEITCYCCDRVREATYYVSTRQRFVSQNILDFLPVRTALVGSSNGILCCRSLDLSRCKIDRFHNVPSVTKLPLIEPPLPLVFYICNPATKEWISLRLPPRFNLGKAFGFAFDPDGPSFTLVGLQHSCHKPGRCSFVIYDSKLKTWRKSKEFDCFALGIHPEKHVFLNGRCYWITYRTIFDESRLHDCDFHMVIFDIMNESCEVIKLPHLSTRDSAFPRRCCLGVSKGHVLYVCAYRYEMKIWQFDPNETTHFVPAALRFPSLAEFLNEPFPPIDDPEQYVCSSLVKPYYLYDDGLFLGTIGKLGYYNIKSGEYVPHLGISTNLSYDTMCLMYWPTSFPLKRFGIRRLQTQGCYPCTRTRKRKRSVLSPKRSPLS